MSDKNFRLPDDCRVVVIGGLGDIGQAIVRQFLDLGASVVATGIDDGQIADSPLADAAGVALHRLDATDEAHVAAFSERVGPVDVLVNCAGILRRDAEYDLATFRRVVDVNLTGTFITCMAFRDALARRKGAIVNIASMNAFAALPRIPAYCASKAGIVMLTKSLAHAWASEGIRVNAVAPGYIETALNAEGRRDQAHYERIAQRTAFKRWGAPEEVAGTVAYLAMPASAYVTGAVLAVDGGFLAG